MMQPSELRPKTIPTVTTEQKTDRAATGLLREQRGFWVLLQQPSGLERFNQCNKPYLGCAINFDVTQIS